MNMIINKKPVFKKGKDSCNWLVCFVLFQCIVLQCEMMHASIFILTENHRLHTTRWELRIPQLLAIFVLHSLVNYSWPISYQLSCCMPAETSKMTWEWSLMPSSLVVMKGSTCWRSLVAQMWKTWLPIHASCCRSALSSVNWTRWSVTWPPSASYRSLHDRGPARRRTSWRPGKT